MPKLSPKASPAKKKARVKTEMHKFGQGKLHSGSRSGPIVKSPKQAVAIAMSESGQSKKSAKAAPVHRKIAERVQHHEALASKHRAHADLNRAKLKVAGKRINYDGKIVDDNGSY